MYDISQGLVGNKKKLTENYVGPYEIIDIYNNGQNYKIRLLKQGSEAFDTHLNHIRPFKMNKIPPKEIALKSLENNIIDDNNQNKQIDKKQRARYRQLLGRIDK